MRKTDALFKLIKSLTKTEKRYLTLEARKAGRGESRYWRLYQLINQQSAYDEIALKKQLKGKLADDKARLYEAILRAMRNYHSQLSHAAQIKEKLLDSSFLYNRGLYDQAYDRLISARDLASKLDDQLTGLEVNKEIRRVANTLFAGQQTEDLAVLIAEKDQHIEKLERELKVLDIHDEIIREVHAAGSGKKATDKEALLYRYGQILLEAKPPVSTQGALRYYQSRGLLGSLLADPKMIYENYVEVLQIWEQQPTYKREEFTRYLDDASNLFSASLRYAPARESSLPLLEQLEAESPASTHDRRVLFQRTASARLAYYLNYDNERPAGEVVAPIEQGLQQYQLNTVASMVIRFNAAILFFIQEESEACERWLSDIIQLKRSDVRPDILMASHLLRATTLFDQELPFEFFENQLRAEGRFVQKQEDAPLKAFGRYWLRSLRKLANVAGKRERRKLLEEYLQEVEDDWTLLPLGLHELMKAWLRAKLSSKSVVASLG